MQKHKRAFFHKGTDQVSVRIFTAECVIKAKVVASDRVEYSVARFEGYGDRLKCFGKLGSTGLFMFRV